MDGIGLVGHYPCLPAKLSRASGFEPFCQPGNRLASSRELLKKKTRTHAMKPSRFHRLTASSWRRPALAPAALFVVGVLHAQTAPNHTSTNTTKLPEPVTLLSFDEGTGTFAADSVGDHPATLIGQAGWATGLVGPWALGLPGLAGSYADITSTVVDTTQSFSVAAWVNLDNTNGYQTFVSQDTPGGESAFFLQKRADSGQFSFTVPYDFFTNPQSLFTPVPGQWYHVAGVYDATAHSATLYVNGVLTDQILNVTPTAASGHSAVGPRSVRR